MILRRRLLILAVEETPVVHTFNIISDNGYVGKYFYCVAKYDNEQVFGTWSIISGSQYASINENGKVTINEGVTSQPITIYCSYEGVSATRTITVSYDNQLTIECSDELYGTSGNAIARYNSNIISPIWSITSGPQFATINSDGEITITGTGDVTISASYNGYQKYRNIHVNYVSGQSSTTEVSTDGSVTTTTTTTVVNQDGSTTETSTSNTTHEDGSVSTTESETTTNQDGSSTTTSTTTNQDGTSSESETNVASDGSSTSTTTNYNSEGEPTSGSNNTTDTQGNSSTQNLIYDENGNETVTGYTIDTSENPEGTKQFNGDGVNTEYYAFDLTHGFVIDFNFTINFSQQPAGQNENHHNILTMKRATPEPWYGFQLRQTSSNKYVILGAQFSTGSNVNTQLTPASITNNTAEYNLKITYNPTLSANTFVCKDMLTGDNVYVSNKLFPDLEELRYLKVTIGYAMDENGDPYRYSNINVKNFEIKRLSNVSEPVISCDGRQIAITCDTVGATIYYRLNLVGNYAIYSSPISISEDTIVQAYAVLDNETSETVTETCQYDNGIEVPVITCDGEYVTIACATTDATIYYRLNETGDYSEYTDSFQINATTVVEAYAEIDGQTGRVAKETCTYSPIVLESPSIICSGDTITITCATANADIYYKLNQTGNYIKYTTPITISEDTIVEAYSQYRGRVSSVVTENCEYSPVHHYENDYLTFKVRTAGKLYWRSNGGLTRSIDYSLNNGEWTTITSAATPPTITVAVNDVVRFRATNASYATSKSAYSGFGQGEAGTANAQSYDSDAAELDIEGNIMSLIYGDNFVGQTTFNGSTYNFCSLFKKLKVISAENLILPALTLRDYCYRAMFSWCTYLEKAPQLPATTLTRGVYWYMFERCAITTAPDLLAETLVAECYGNMFVNCSSLNFIKCMANSGFSTTNCKQTWVNGVASSGTFVKDSGVTTSTWTRGTSGIPTNWQVYDNVAVVPPTITYDGFSTITLGCETQGATIYYKLNNTGNYAAYSAPLTISADTLVQAYSELNGAESRVVSQTCVYVSDVPIEASNRDLKKWQYSGQEITTPYSVNAIDGHSSSYAKGTFNFETSVALRNAQPAYLWFQHADQSASIYVDDTLVEKHWGGYTAFTVDISNYVHSGSNSIKVSVKNNEGNYLAPAAGDFNFNATLGNVKLLTSPCLPSMNYGYDGFHITSSVTDASATINVRTTVPNGSSVMCSISDGTYSWSDTQTSDGTEMTFTTVITNPHLWNGTIDPHLYTVTMEISKDNVLYHRFQRPYGLRYYEYVINDIVKVGDANNPYTGFLLNGSPYLLRGVCMHDDIEGKANALSESDYNSTFATIQELGCNFIRLAHYPHPKEVYDRCDQMGIIVQTEAPCVNKMQSTMPADYYTHLETQYSDMVNQHYNHPCIVFWGLSNETTTDDKAFAKEKIEGYTTLIKNLDSERMVGYVLAQGTGLSPSAYYNDPSVDWFGCNIYVGWYDSPNSNTPTSQINSRINNTINKVSKPMAYSEYGCGGTQHCHSEEFMTTTTRGNYERHDIEYMMWLHEGHIETIKNYPQLLFTAQWQLFDIAVSNRNEGYTVCLDGETTSTDDNLRRLNNKGLVERDHVTKKDAFYLYKAWWNTDPFVHICGKDYTKTADRVIKCYSNDGDSLSLYVNGIFSEMVTVANNIATFTARNFNSGDIVRVDSENASDTFTFGA